MDFLEGFLMGPIWSDTEYETRRHTGFYWLIGWLAIAAFAWLVIFPAKRPGFLNMPGFLPVLLFFLLSLGSPFACRYYYRLNIMLKLGILLLQIVKFGFAFVALFQFWLPRIQLDLATLPATLLDYVNKTVARTSDFFATLGSGLGMMMGIISGGLIIVLTFAGGLLAATLIPALYLVIAKLIQRGIDLLARTTVIKELD